MKKQTTFLLFSFMCLAVSCVAPTGRELWYRQPAAAWEEALPIGNGRLGAMIFGNPENEKLQLNDITVWSGGVAPNADIPDAYVHLPEIRQALRDKDFRKAQELTRQYMVAKVSKSKIKELENWMK